MAIGALDANGVWIYGEDDPASPVSDLLNLGMDSVSDTIGDARARLTTLEAPPAAAIGVSYAAGWANYGGAFAPVTLYKDRDGYIRLSGLFKRTGATITNAASGTIFTLPVGARPVGNETFMTNKDNAIVFTAVGSDGIVQIASALTWASGSSYMYVTGIMFKAAL